MGKTRSFCPYCFRVVPAGKQCPCRERARKERISASFEAIAAEFDKRKAVKR